jgi:arylsulfatase A-like enzyme
MMSSIDVLPTALALGHMTLADDFMNQARGGDVLANDIKGKPVFGMGGREEGSFSLAFGDWKYIYRPDGQDSLYSLSSDPHELHDLRKLNPKVSEEMRERLIAEISSQKKANEIYSTGMDNQTLDPEHLEQLRALGYTGEE